MVKSSLNSIVWCENQKGTLLNYLKVSTVTFCSLASTFNTASAENYFGIYAGGQFGTKGTNLNADKDVNYMGHGHPAPNLIPSTASDILLSPSLTFGFKAGRYFDSMPGFGIEVEGQYSRPDFKQQDVTINLSQPVGGVSSFTMNQEGADFHMLMGGVNLMYRFNQFERFKPYVGAGPAVFALGVRGEDYNFDPMVSKGVGVGFNAKAGVEIPISERWSFDTEYKFSYGKMDIDWFRSFNDVTVDYQAHNITTGLRFKF